MFQALFKVTVGGPLTSYRPALAALEADGVGFSDDAYAAFLRAGVASAEARQQQVAASFDIFRIRVGDLCRDGGGDRMVLDAAAHQGYQPCSPRMILEVLRQRPIWPGTSYGMFVACPSDGAFGAIQIGPRYCAAGETWSVTTLSAHLSGLPWSIEAIYLLAKPASR